MILQVTILDKIKFIIKINYDIYKINSKMTAKKLILICKDFIQILIKTV